MLEAQQCCLRCSPSLHSHCPCGVVTAVQHAHWPGGMEEPCPSLQHFLAVWPWKYTQIATSGQSTCTLTGPGTPLQALQGLKTHCQNSSSRHKRYAVRHAADEPGTLHPQAARKLAHTSPQLRRPHVLAWQEAGCLLIPDARQVQHKTDKATPDKYSTPSLVWLCSVTGQPLPADRSQGRPHTTLGTR